MQAHHSTPAPPWLKAGAVYSHRGGTEKVLSLDAVSLKFVSATGFGTWLLSGFLAAVERGEIVAAPGARPLRAVSDSSAVKTYAPDPALLVALGRVVADRARPRDHALRWMRAISTGDAVEPWQHLLGIALIRLGASRLGLDVKAANPAGRGRKTLRQAEAQATQALVGSFETFLAGGEPISQQDWAWLRHLVEQGMIAVGMMPAPQSRSPGRPVTPGGPGRIIEQHSELRSSIRGRGVLARLFREQAMDIVRNRRRVAAAWADQDHTSISVSRTDPEVIDEIRRVETGFYKSGSRRRARAR